LEVVIGLTADFHPQKGEEENKQKRKTLNERESASAKEPDAYKKTEAAEFTLFERCAVCPPPPV
jgi:hypothetical protein